jgi:hypothetical protein
MVASGGGPLSSAANGTTVPSRHVCAQRERKDFVKKKKKKNVSKFEKRELQT